MNPCHLPSYVFHSVRFSCSLMKRWITRWPHQQYICGLLSRQEGDLFTFNIIDVTPSAQISMSKPEQPWVENPGAVKADSSWEDKQDAQVTFLEGINSQLLLKFQNWGCSSNVECIFPPGSIQSDVGRLHIKSTGRLIFSLETKTSRSQVPSHSFPGHYP